MIPEISRQVTRAEERAAKKFAASTLKANARRTAKRALLERQTLREKSDAYTGRSVAAAIAPSRSRLDKRKVQKGKPFGRILVSETIGSREYSYHATKGVRSHRA